MEFIDLYDSDRNKTLLKQKRGDFIADEMYRLTVHICLFNSQGEMLIQQRDKNKKVFPEYWDITVGGGVQAGESSKDASHRELLEELGIDFDFSKERPLFTFNFQSGFDDFFVIEKDIDLKSVNFVDGEVQAVKWASREEILSSIESGSFIKYYPSIINLIFDTRKTRNAFRV